MVDHTTDPDRWKRWQIGNLKAFDSSGSKDRGRSNRTFDFEAFGGSATSTDLEVWVDGGRAHLLRGAVTKNNRGERTVLASCPLPETLAELIWWARMAARINGGQP